MFKTLKCDKCTKLYGCVAYEELGELLCRDCPIANCAPASKDYCDHIEQTCPECSHDEYQPFNRFKNSPQTQA